MERVSSLFNYCHRVTLLELLSELAESLSCSFKVLDLSGT